MMNRRRTADELSLEELERLVLLRRREQRLRQLRERGLAPDELPQLPAPPPTEAPPLARPRDRLAFLRQPRRRPAQLPAPPEKQRSPREQLLLLAELAGLAGLVVAVILFVADLRQLNADAASAQSERVAAVATATPPPRAELPGGSLPPDDTPIPAIYQSWIDPQSGGEAAVPQGDTSTQGHPTRIVIPRIGVDAPVVPGDDWEALKAGAGHHLGSANPGERGNMVISAHNDVFGEIFRHLEELEPGDEIIVYDGAGRSYRYQVADKRIVEPTEVSVMDPTAEPVVTLITCHPYLIDTQRMVVIGELAGN